MGHRPGRSASQGEIDASLAGPVEIRVHGIGRHDEWSALGSPGLAIAGERMNPDVALPPQRLTHPLRLISWTRTSRRSLGWLWYLAIPFTIANATGEMAPRTGAFVRGVHSVCRWVGALTITFLATLWLIAIGETFVHRLPWETPSGLQIWQYVTLASCVLLGIVGLYRAGNGKTGVRWGTAVAHALVIGATAVAAVVLRPVHLVVGDVRGWKELITTFGPADAAAWDAATADPADDLFYDGPWVHHLDALTAGTAAAIGLVAVVYLVLVLTGILVARRTVRQESTPDGPSAPSTDRAAMAGTAIALMTATLLLASVGSALRLGLENAIAYFSRHLADGGIPRFESAGVVPFRGRGQPPTDWMIDLLPLLGFVAAMTLAVAMAAAGVFAPGEPPPRWRWADRRLHRAVWIHRALTGLRSTLLVSAMIAGAAFLVVCMLGLRWLSMLDASSWWWGFLVIAVQIISVGVFVPLAFRGPRTALGVLADVLGFWPVRHHPLAGLSYRTFVVDTLHKELEVERADGAVRVVVGHSQGSVIAAWTLAHGPAVHPNPILLVTCGTPIRSLYGTFFPAHFGPDFFRAVHRKAPTWVNFWRPTDPIANALDLPGCVTDVELPDPESTAAEIDTDAATAHHGSTTPVTSLLKHGDYWIAAEQRRRIARAVATGLPERAADQPSDTTVDDRAAVAAG